MGLPLGRLVAPWSTCLEGSFLSDHAIRDGLVPEVPNGGMKNSGVGRGEGLGELLSCNEEKVINLCSSQVRGE